MYAEGMTDPTSAPKGIRPQLLARRTLALATSPMLIRSAALARVRRLYSR